MKDLNIPEKNFWLFELCN